MNDRASAGLFRAHPIAEMKSVHEIMRTATAIFLREALATLARAANTGPLIQVSNSWQACRSCGFDPDVWDSV